MDCWEELIKANDVNTIIVTFSPGIDYNPVLPLIRNLLKNRSWPAPICWSASEEVKAISAPINDNFDLIIYSGEHTLYLINRRAATILWHAALPLGLLDLKQTYCQSEPPEPDMLIALRRHIVQYLELIQFHTPIQKAVLISDYADFLARLRLSPSANPILSHEDIETYLAILSHESTAAACRHLGTELLIGHLLLPTALICHHILDYLQLAAIEVLPLELRLPEQND